MPETPASRPLPPPLEFPPPPCTICGDDCDYDDGWFCVPCGISWDEPAHHNNGAWDEPDKPQCTSRWSPYQGLMYDAYPALKATTYRCRRTDGHDGNHVAPDSLQPWTDKEADDEDES